MAIPSSLISLLCCFDMDVRTGMWWIILDDYLLSEPNVDEVIAHVDALEDLLKRVPNEAQLAEELIAIGCLYAPDTSYHSWLESLASALKERIAPVKAPKFGLKRPCRI